MDMLKFNNQINDLVNGQNLTHYFIIFIGVLFKMKNRSILQIYWIIKIYVLYNRQILFRKLHYIKITKISYSFENHVDHVIVQSFYLQVAKCEVSGKTFTSFSVI